MPSDSDLQLAHELASIADALTLTAFRSGPPPSETKPDGTPVTPADRDTEEALRRKLREARPGDAVIGEELGEERRGGRAWVIDPIDGTANFMRGIPVFATLIALEEEGVPVLGVASAPALQRRWWAQRGAGAQNERGEIRVSPLSTLAQAQLLFADLERWRAHGTLERLLALAADVKRTRGYGDFWMHLLVAEGAAEVACEPAVAHWDVAAVQVIVEEAGGRFSHDHGVALSTNGLLHDLALARLAAG